MRDAPDHRLRRAVRCIADDCQGVLAQRALQTRRVIAVGCLAGLALSPRLWFGPREFPLAPVWDGLPAAPLSLAVGLYVVMIGLLAISLLPRARWALAAFLALAAAWSLGDQNRWQPWLYQYMAMLFCLLRAERANASDDQRRSDLNACRLIVAGTYLWSGLQKANASFLEVVYPWMLKPAFPEGLPDWFAWTGFVIPPLEAAIGLALLIPRLRTAAIVAVCVMHGLILLSIGPFGHSWNTVVWPWNVAMPMATILLFARSGEESFRTVVWGRFDWLHRAMAVLFLLLPALSFWGWWDSYLSASLYSGNTLQGVLVFSDQAYHRLPATARSQCEDAGNNRYELKLFTWTMKDLNAPPYPARRVFLSVHRETHRRYAQQPGDVILAILERPSWRSPERKLTQQIEP